MGYKDSTLLPTTHNSCDAEVDLPSSVFLLSVSPGGLRCDVCDREQIICCLQEHPLGGRQLKVICAIYETEAIFLLSHCLSLPQSPTFHPPMVHFISTWYVL